MKRLFIITGATGFLGSNIIRLLSQNKENEIRALVLKNDKLESSLDEFNCQKYYGDVTDLDSLQEIFDISDCSEIYVIHCAAIVYIGSKYQQKVYDVNVEGTKNVANMALQAGAKLIYVSSVHALTEKKDNEPIREMNRFEPEKIVGLYGQTKAIAGNYLLDMVKEKNLNCCIVHPSGIIGPNDTSNSHMSQLIKDYYQGKLNIAVKGGYDFVDVRDVASGIISCCYKGKIGESYILSNRYVSIKELLDIVSEETGKEKIKVFLPSWLAMITAPFVEAYCLLKKQRALYTNYSIYTLNSNSNFINEKAKRQLDYKNRDLRETIADTIQTLKLE